MKLIYSRANSVKNHLLKWVLPAFLMIFLVNQPKEVKAQNTLALGDAVFTLYNSDSPVDSFAIMFTRDITSGTTIVITDGCWRDAVGYFELNNFGVNSKADWVIEWQATSTITAYTQIAFWSTSGVQTAKANCTHGTVTGGTGLAIPPSGDQLFVCQAGTIDSASSPPRYTPARILCGLHANRIIASSTSANWDVGTGSSTSNSEKPDSLNTGAFALWLINGSGGCTTCQPAGSGEYDNARYDCSVTAGTAAAVRAAANDSDKWVYDDINVYPTVCTPPPCTWNGATWSCGTPGSTTDAIIASSTTPGAFTCEDLTINSTFDLTLNSGVTATIHGDVTNNGNGTSGVGTLRFVKAGTQSLNGTAFTHAGVIEIATGATLTTNDKLTLENGASLMHGTNTPNGGGSISGNVTFQKTIGSSTHGWRMFSLPVDALINSFENGLQTNCNNFNPSDRRNVYFWNATAAGAAPLGGNYATGWAQADSATDDDTKAYAIYLSNSSNGFFDFSSTVSITGTPNNGDRTFSLQYTYDPDSSGTVNITRGWNMIPNYFPSNLGVYNLINDANFGTTYKAIHVWNQGSSQMEAMNQSSRNTYRNSTSIFSTLRQISPFTAFWVKATSTSQSIQLKNSMRISRTDSLPANTYFKNDFDIFRIEVKDNDGWMDQFSTCFDAAASDGMDYDMDIYKFKSMSAEVPTLYTKISDGEKLAFSSVPVKTSYSIPVFMESYKDGKQYTVSPITEEYSNYYDVELVDNKTGAKTNLLTTNYTFNHDVAYKNARFTLNFSQKATVSVDEIFNQEKTWAFTNENGINVTYQNKNELAKATVEIYNMLGQQLYTSAPVNGDQTVTYKPAKNEGANVYIVKVISNGKAQSIKVAY